MIPPYRYERPHDPPPPPELIDALADQPLAPEIAECTAIVEMTVYKILARLREQGHVSGGRAARGRQPAATYSLREAQPCP